MLKCLARSVGSDPDAGKQTPKSGLYVCLAGTDRAAVTGSKHSTTGNASFRVQTCSVVFLHGIDPVAQSILANNAVCWTDLAAFRCTRVLSYAFPSSFDGMKSWIVGRGLVKGVLASGGTRRTRRKPVVAILLLQGRRVRLQETSLRIDGREDQERSSTVTPS